MGHYQICGLCSCVITKFCLSGISEPVLRHFTVGRSHFASCLFLSTKKFNFPLRSSFHLTSLLLPVSSAYHSPQRSHRHPISTEQLLQVWSWPGLGKTLAQRGLPPSKPVYFFGNVTGDTVVAGNATLSDADTSGNSSLRRDSHSYDLPCC